MEVTASMIGTFQLAGSASKAEEAQAENGKQQLKIDEDTLSISPEGKEAASGLSVASLGDSEETGYEALAISTKSTVFDLNRRIEAQKKEEKRTEDAGEKSPEEQIEDLQEEIRELQEEIEQLKQQGASKEQIAAKQAQLTALQTQLLDIMQKQGKAGSGGTAGGTGGTGATSASDIAAQMVNS